MILAIVHGSKALMSAPHETGIATDSPKQCGTSHDMHADHVLRSLQEQYVFKDEAVAPSAYRYHSCTWSKDLKFEHMSHLKGRTAC